MLTSFPVLSLLAVTRAVNSRMAACVRAHVAVRAARCARGLCSAGERPQQNLVEKIVQRHVIPKPDGKHTQARVAQSARVQGR